MEKDNVISTVFKHSSVKALQVCANLVNSIQNDLDQGFKFEVISSYSHNLSVLKDLLCCHSDKISEESCKGGDGESLSDIKAKVVEKICLPLLEHLYPSTDSRSEVQVLLGAVGKMIAVCVQDHDDTLCTVLEYIYSNISKFSDAKPTSYDLQHDKSLIDIHTILEVTRHVVKTASSERLQNEKIVDKFRSIFFKLTDTLEYISVELVGSVCIPVMLNIIKVNNSNVSEYIDVIWKYILNFSHLNDQRKQFLLLCGFANYFFPVIGDLRCVDVRCKVEFWEILQSGLINKDSVNRKRSMYLLKRIVDICESAPTEVNTDQAQPVFWWSKDRSVMLSKTWQDFMLLAEVLEEKQVHVIKPLLPRMKLLVKASEMNAIKGPCLLHTSWLRTILLRSSYHESLQIIRWSADTVLSLDLYKCPMIEQGLQQYLTGEMLYSLQEPKLYNREQGSSVGTMPAMAEKLVTFFVTCWEVMSPEKRGPFFCQMIENISSRHWGQISLIFISRGLAQVPATPCLDKETVQGLRKILTGLIVAMDSYFRGSIQGYVVQILIKLVDKNVVPLEDFVQIMCLVRREESLQRGTTLWTRCVTWFKEGGANKTDWDRDGMTSYLENSVTKYLQTSLDSKYTTADSAAALVVARTLLLASDASIATKMDENNSSTLIRITQTLSSVLNSINTHAYMSTHKADKAILLLTLLIIESKSVKGHRQDDEVLQVIYNAVENCQAESLMFIGRQISDSIVSLSDMSLLDLYMDYIQLLAKLIPTVRNVQFDRLVDTCIGIVNRPEEAMDLPKKLQQLSAVCILGTLSNFLSHDLTKSHDQGSRQHVELRNKICHMLKTWKLTTNFTKPAGDQRLSQQEWGKISSLFLENEWKVVEMALQHSAAPWCDMLELLTLAEDTLSVGTEQTSVIVLKCLSMIIPKVKEQVSEDRLTSILGTCWASFQESRRILAFWDVLEAFVQAAYQPCLLQMEEDSLVIATLTEYADKLVVLGKDKNGIVNALATQLCKVWCEPSMILHADKFIPTIVDLCMFGALIKRGVRQSYDIHAALEADGDSCPAYGVVKPQCNEDVLVRVTVINFLCRLKPDNQSHCCLATKIMKHSLQMYDDVAKGSTNRFANSQVHRQRHRLIQTVLLLKAFITKDYIDELWKITWGHLECETQPSVRHLLEWIAMWLMHRNRHLRDQLWMLFEKYRDSKNLTLCSLLCIVIHMGPHLPADEQSEYFKQALPNILPWCMAHHFHTRIYSQAVLAKLWDQCQQLGLHDIIKQHSILACIVDFSQQNSNCTRNVKKLLDSFFFKFLDFERDYTLETIYKTMSQMTSLTEEDWIQPEQFIENSSIWNDGAGFSLIQVRNDVSDLDQCDPGLWKYISLKNPADDDVADDNTAAADDTESDVQKKIMPWRQMMMDEETMSEVDHGVKQQIENGLVVVTSLINKVPNLGGLCRTSEIFGVSEYVIGKMGYVHDKAFQVLSVTAHQWIPITEVYETKLVDYLQQKRQEGYTLVGVEQTANSVCLTEYTFPEKTLLLLGNEKEGIPVELISLLDVCVEIPQQGVIRSLNVHVSGAILIWEYRRQQLMKTCSS